MLNIDVNIELKTLTKNLEFALSVLGSSIGLIACFVSQVKAPKKLV